MARVLIPYEGVWVFNDTLLNWIGETQDSWFRFFLETFIHHDGDDIVLREYFDAIFHETDWEWRNKIPSPFADLIGTIENEYRLFRRRLSQYIGFVQNVPPGYAIDFYSVEFINVGIMFSVSLREIPDGPPAI